MSRSLRFLRRQIEEIHSGGLSVIVRKTGTLILAPPALLVVAAVRALRPLVVVRFGPLQSSRIGHFAANTEVYLCERDAGMHGRRTLDIFYHQPSVSNLSLKQMWDRTLHISRFASLPDRLNRWLPGGQDHVIPERRSQSRDIHGLLARTSPHLSFSPEEENRGREALQELGILDGAPFICFHARDLAYLEVVERQSKGSVGYQYHDYRDSLIQNYLPAVEELARGGYFVIRMGAVVNEALPATDRRIIDYALNGRTDFLDVYLSAKCRFFLGCGSGIDCIARIFRRPTALVNMVPLEYVHTWSPDDLFIPKKLWLREERRFLKFREILDSGIGRYHRSEQYRQGGIEVIENTPEEITAMVVEMDERLDGTWLATEEDEELQRRFWSLFTPNEVNGVFLSRIGAEFLRENRELLE